MISTGTKLGRDEAENFREEALLQPQFYTRSRSSIGISTPRPMTLIPSCIIEEVDQIYEARLSVKQILHISINITFKTSDISGTESYTILEAEARCSTSVCGRAAWEFVVRSYVAYLCKPSPEKHKLLANLCIKIEV